MFKLTQNVFFSQRPRSISQREALLRAARDHPHRWHSDILSRNVDSHLRSSSDKERSSSNESESNKRPAAKSPSSNAISYGEELQYWIDKDGRKPTFTHIASLYSELLAVNTQGQLCQWRWSDPEPFYSAAAPSLLHPKTAALGLASEVITHLSASIVRASLATASGKVVTLVDESIASATASARVEHTAIAWPEFEPGIAEIHTSTLYTLVRLNNDALFWWGVMPFELRKKIAQKTRVKSTKKQSKGCGSEITCGATVCLRTAPFHNQGAIGFTIHNGVPKVGSLLECAWSLTDSCRFKVLRAGTPSAEGSSERKKNSGNSQDKTDMPPPPSPASSTCSDHSGPAIMSPAFKRKRLGGSVTPVREVATGAALGASAGEEEDWPMSEVVMVEDARNMPVGRVLKVDGNYAAVRFPKDGESVAAPLRTSEDASALLSDCRLLKKEDLIVVRGPAPPRTPELVQRTPRKVALSDGQLMGVCIDDTDISAILKSNGKLQMVIYNMSSGSIEQRSSLPSYTPALLESQYSVRLWAACSSQATWCLMTDGNNTIYPLSPDCLDSVREPNWPGLPPIRCLSAPTPAPGTPAVALLAIVCEQQMLMPHILRCDTEKVEKFLKYASPEDAEAAMKEMCDGGRNILHAAVSQSAPTSAKENDAEALPSGASEAMRLNVDSFTGPPLRAVDSLTSRRAVRDQMHGIREMMRQASFTRSGSSFESYRDHLDPANRHTPPEESGLPPPLPSMPGPPEEFYELPIRYETNAQKAISSSSCAVQEESFTLPPVKLDDKERHKQAVAVLKAILNSSAFCCQAINLLKARDADGLTPLMRAVWMRAYKASQLLLDIALNLCPRDEETLMSMVFPPGSPPDLSPLHMLVANDTCSFTWTGAYHIQQDIFECRTCGLTGTLCCCTECARVCHRGHDCQMKQTAPTAYCDCWEKCACKTLVAGSQNDRMALLTSLLRLGGQMVTQPNSNGEHILYFLAATASRQQHEFRQYQRVIERSGTSSSQRQAIKEAAEHAHVDIGQEPPKFARRALEKVLGEWLAVKSLLIADKTETDEERFVQEQWGSTRLDRFTHLLLTKCGNEALTTLLDTLTRNVQNPTTADEAKLAARRFIRSVARIFVVISMETSPSTSSRKGIGSRAALANSMLSTSINKARTVFKHLLPLAVEELCEISDALITPVRLGVAKPTAPFSLLTTSLEAVHAADDLFSVDPLPARRRTTTMDSNSAPPAPPSAVAASVPPTAPVTDRDSDGEGQDSGGNVNEVSHPPTDSDVMDVELQLVESDSESECAPSGDEASVQQSAVTGATAGSEALAFFSDEDDEEEDTVVGGEDDDQSVPDDDQSQRDNEEHDEDSDTGSFSNDRPLLQSSSTNRHASAPASMQWAVSTSPRPVSRRSGFIESSNSASMATTISQLSRAFGIVIRMISDLLSDVVPRKEADGFPGLHLSTDEDIRRLKQHVENQIQPTWLWMKSILDSTEAQLRYGCGLNSRIDVPQGSKANRRPTNTAIGEPRIHALQVLERSTNNRRSGNSARFVLAPSSSSSDTHFARRDFFTYALSLMRSHNNEHADSLPSLDVAALKHVAYVLDATVYYIRNVGGVTGDHNYSEEVEDSDMDETEITCRKHRFFQRSPSVMQIGCTPPDPFKEPMTTALPLADQPHLLHPHARRDELFGSGISPTTNSNLIPTPMSLSQQSEVYDATEAVIPQSHEALVGKWRHTLHLFGRVFSDDVGAEAGSIISELGGFPVKEAKFRRETERLRTNQQRDLIIEVSRNPSSEFLVAAIRQINMAYSRRVSSISSGSAPPLAVHKVKVTFKDEPGEGSGVARSFYTAFANAVLSLDPLPALEPPPNSGTSSNYPDIVTKIRQQQRRISAPRPRRQRSLLTTAEIANIAQSSPSTHDHEYEDRRQQLFRRVSLIHPSLASKITGILMDLPTNCQVALLSNEEALRQRVEHAVEVLVTQESSRSLSLPPSMHSDIIDLDIFNFTPSSSSSQKEEEVNDRAPLFWQPGKRGYYSPRPGNGSSERLNAMRCIGRVAGLCLLQNELFPLHFCRHVLKYMLCRKVAWHDLAFFDPPLYDNLRQLVNAAESEDGEKILTEMHVSMTAPADDSNNPTREIELYRGSQDVIVTPANVYHYVRFYAQRRLVDNVRAELENLADGLHDVLPASSLEGLTAEDLRLLLNGQGDICVQTLQSYTSFTDESGENNSEKVAKFKKWFWAVVEKMTTPQKQDLVYFWTSSPALPASEEGFQPMPSITIRPPDDAHLPTANTCISRLYIPLYSSRAILRSKLLSAILTRTFGYV